MKFRYVVVILLSVLTLSACANNHPANSDHASGSPASSITSDSHPQSSIEYELSTESVMIHSQTELSNDCSVLIDDVPFSLHESRQDILAKLEQVGLSYSESTPENLEEAKYDFYYNTDLPLQIYFFNDECVRLRLIKNHDGNSGEIIWKGKSISPGNTVSQMLEQFGDEYETHSYNYKGVYTIYRYSFEDCIYEFGIEGEESDSIYNLDIYVPSQAPIYDYGEEIQENS